MSRYCETRFTVVSSDLSGHFLPKAFGTTLTVKV